MRHLKQLMILLVGITLVTGSAAIAQQIPYFDGHQAFDLLEKQVAFGPRYPNSPGHKAMEEFLESYLTARADKLEIHRVTLNHPYKGGKMPVVNYIARFNLVLQDRILLLAHYDTREIADQETDIKKMALPILGANDGASGVAILLTIADILSRESPAIGVDLLFVDAEDIGRAGDTRYFSMGTKAFIPVMTKYLGGVRPRYAVLLDMVGDAELRLPVEPNSWNNARNEVNKIWNLAADLGYTQFVFEMGETVYDDHIPFHEAGIPAVDIIDFDYPNDTTNYWHTLEDTPDKCSPERLEVVGSVITALICTEKF